MVISIESCGQQPIELFVLGGQIAIHLPDAGLHEFDVGGRGLPLQALTVGFGSTFSCRLRASRCLPRLFEGAFTGLVLANRCALPLLCQSRLMLHFGKESASTRHAHLYLLS
ncbi:hypothetical protein [Clavibacter phaseoli]|uniref:hypothetical protein n=1 Tax=Clavibacter phaseoli TaxID=1734031 RepID=UPI001E55787A|nr:hypothetical protein [Clavibacter phaseoli]